MLRVTRHPQRAAGALELSVDVLRGSGKRESSSMLGVAIGGLGVWVMEIVSAHAAVKGLEKSYDAKKFKDAGLLHVQAQWV